MDAVPSEDQFSHGADEPVSQTHHVASSVAIQSHLAKGMLTLCLLLMLFVVVILNLVFLGQCKKNKSTTANTLGAVSMTLGTLSLLLFLESVWALYTITRSGVHREKYELPALIFRVVVLLMSTITMFIATGNLLPCGSSPNKSDTAAETFMYILLALVVLDGVYNTYILTHRGAPVVKHDV